MKHQTKIIIILLFFSLQLYSQEEKFLEIENGISIVNNRELSCLSFSTDQSYKEFHDALLKEFGSPRFEEYIAIFDSVRNFWWAKEPIIIRYRVFSIQGSHDNWKNIGIMAETISPEKRDLLIPGTKSYKRIKRFINRKINRHFE